MSSLSLRLTLLSALMCASPFVHAEDTAAVVVAALQQPEPPAAPQAEISSASLAIARPADINQLKQGSWSLEVMGMARAAGCQGDGAWITGRHDGEETYQVFCDSPRQFVAVCMVAGCVSVD